MQALFDLLEAEPEPAVRAVLGNEAGFLAMFTLTLSATGAWPAS